MRSTLWSDEGPGPPPGTVGFGAPATVPDVRPVWVDLDKLFWGAASEQAVFDGLDITGRARGLLYRWLRSSRGDWLGEVNFEIYYVDGRPKPTVWYRQLVPGYALSPREDNRPLG